MQFKRSAWPCLLPLLLLTLASPAFAQPDPSDVALWHPGTYGSPLKSLEGHFRLHGREVGAADVAQYARKAKGVLQARGKDRWTSGREVPGSTAGVRRFAHGTQYIDLVRTDTGIGRLIISFGSANGGSR
jgi:hypothetical protein